MLRNWVLEIAFSWLTNYMGECGFILYKGPKAPRTDPNVGLAALENAKLGKEYLDFTKQSYKEDAPNRDRINALAIEVQEGFIKDSNLNRTDAEDYRNYNQTVFRPLEKDIVNNANEYDTAGRREAEAAKGLSDVRQSFDNQRDMTMRNNERAGINPNSGNAMALTQQMDVQEAIAGADAMNKGRTRAEMTGNAMKMDAASLGRNLPSNQAQSMQMAGQAATGAVNTEFSNSANNRAGLSIIGSGYNRAMEGYSQQANILQNQYNGKVSAYNAQQSGGGLSGIGSIIGAGASLYTALKDGGEVEPQPEGLALVGPNEPIAHEGTGEVEGAGTHTSDSILAKLSNEEFVLNAGTQKLSKEQIIAAAKKTKSSAGLKVLESINNAGLKFREAN